MLETLPPILIFVLPLFVLVAAAEGWYLTKRRNVRYDWGAFWASLGDAVGRRLIVTVLGVGIIAAILAFVWQHRIGTIPMGHAWAWLAVFVGVEFCYYWMHRADHRIRWLWATHAVHHSPNQFVLANAYRLGWTSQVGGTAVFMAPVVWIGFTPGAVLGALAANLVYQFWIHTELVGRLGPLEWVLNTPSHHRVHHASNGPYLDRNYGGVLIVFDRLFGTFAEERADTPLRYGLVQPLVSNNPVRIAFHGWRGLLRELGAVRRPRDLAVALLGPPERSVKA